AAGELAAIEALRARLRAALAHWGLPERADTAELLAAELLANALSHTAAGAVLAGYLDEQGRLRVEVADHSGRLPRQRRAHRTATSGRGLMLVEALAEDWGVRLRGEGKVTWFTLAAGPQAPGRESAGPTPADPV
ncbi:ATP-binding protein, partial [Kitasatospora nipponensis]|uniref:ATP-binding protein n=1 Tax=Kitasatospora nipponensis TaxID=258049 RepID=UPI0031DFA681